MLLECLPTSTRYIFYINAKVVYMYIGSLYDLPQCLGIYVREKFKLKILEITELEFFSIVIKLEINVLK